jgi:proline dehydrogenase
VGTLSKLRRMVLRENVSLREAARRLRISRNTAKRWLAEPEMVEPIYLKRVACERLIDAYTEHLQLWIKADAHRGKRERRPVKAYHEAIRAMGYSGAPTQVYLYCRGLDPFPRTHLDSWV